MNEYSRATPWQRIKGYIFHLFPHHVVSRLSYYLARLETPLTPVAIRLYIRFFKVDMSEAEEPDAENYRNFNDFFTRSLRSGVRPIHDDPKTLVSPCDGIVSQVGGIEKGLLLQAKGQHYPLEELLGGTAPQARRDATIFASGKFLTIYLAPGNYHRVHAPCDLTLKTMTHIPGRLFSVARYAPKVIPRLYVRNERVVSMFESPFGDIAVILVGALNVGSIETAWGGLVTPGKFSVSQNRYTNEPLPRVEFQRGEEIGRFNLGSTVIVLVSNPGLSWKPLWAPGKDIRLGEELGWVDAG